MPWVQRATRSHADYSQRPQFRHHFHSQKDDIDSRAVLRRELHAIPCDRETRLLDFAKNKTKGEFTGTRTLDPCGFCQLIISTGINRSGNELENHFSFWQLEPPKKFVYIFRNITACHRRRSSINLTTMSSSDLPNVIANNELRAFRAQGNLSWKDFNALWWHICNFINAPRNDILLDTSSAGETEYEWKIIDIMRDVLVAGLFAPRSRNSWRFNSVAGQEG